MGHYKNFYFAVTYENYNLSVDPNSDHCKFLQNLWITQKLNVHSKDFCQFLYRPFQTSFSLFSSFEQVQLTAL